MSACACTAQQTDFCWTRGDAGRLDVNVTTADGAPYNLADCMLLLTVKNNLSDPDSAAVIRKEVTVHDNEALGKSHFDILKTDNTTDGMRYFDVKLVDANEDPFTLFGGIWKVLKNATNRNAPLPPPEEE